MAQTKSQTKTPLLFILTILVGLFSISTNAFSDVEKAKESFNKGLEYVKANDNASALLAFDLCLKEDPTYIDAYINRGTIYFLEKKYDQALSNFKSATEKDNKNVDAFTNLGKVQYTLQKYAEAELSFKSAIALKEDADTYKELGKVYYKKKDDEAVIATFNKSHELGGGDHLTHYMLGKAYQNLNKNVDAIRELKKSASLQSDYYLAHSTLGQIYLEQENFTQAAAAFKDAMNSKSKNKYRAAYNYAIAVEYSDDKNYEVNIANWKNYIKLAKNNPKAKNLQTAQDHVKELEEAFKNSKLQ